MNANNSFFIQQILTQIPSSETTRHSAMNKSITVPAFMELHGTSSTEELPSYLITIVLSDLKEKYRCCTSSEPDQEDFTENMTFKLKPQRIGTIQKKTGKNAEWSKNGDKCKRSDMSEPCSRKLKDLPGSSA